MSFSLQTIQRTVTSLCLVAAFGAAAASAAIVEDNFNGLDDAAAFPPVGSEWATGGNGGGVTRQSLASDESPFTSATNGRGIRWTDVGGTGGGDAEISQQFAQTTEALQISFDFRINNSGNNNLVPTVTIGSDTTPGLFLNLSREVVVDSVDTYQLTYQTSGSGTFLQNISLGTWYRVVIDTSSVVAGKETFSVSITPHGGSASVYSDLSFRNDVSEFRRIRIANNSLNSSSGSFSIDNVSVVIPEPASIGMLLGPASGLLLMRRAAR